MKLPFGPIIVTRGKFRGRIGLYDDDADTGRSSIGVVKFSSFGISPYYHCIPLSYLAEPNTQQLFRRREQLFWLLSPLKGNSVEGDIRVDALEELHLVDSILGDRLFAARLTQSERGAKLFLSHSSKDKGFVRGLAVDLKHIGHQVWLDEWEILIGESIPKRVAEGLEDSDFVAVVLSKSAVESRWVENEWHSKYWDEINQERVAVLPILIDDCMVPTLLKTKKYADFRGDYADALEELCHAISRHIHT
ncbi:toll/interleukin-1 receptor domain-containing protein [Methylomonas sp. ZR1]|uniref:toll/interleukin-1 receptor domain-containing protein n=1 Tax=Methylomonas sp. ZR1 TaxID=1797072 RepID=UPI001492B50A|nr:toll/interleukin-1 receptor domain-containing protein [Methylomonas sp. ZR1]NOV30801.1 toll/interleukin-1 receptor domain-containing protein [Methylomonas sp. ZR1]